MGKLMIACAYVTCMSRLRKTILHVICKRTLVGRTPTTLRQWLCLTTIYVFVPTAENLQPNQIAAFKRETLQLNLADNASGSLYFSRDEATA